jgi:four helix bundle protein
MGSIVSFRDLDAWTAAMDLTITTYGFCRRFPRDEQYGLVQQMRRAAVSVPSNIAEGHANGPGLRYRNHVRIALGSLAELATQLEIAVRLNYIDADTAKEAATQLARARQLLHGLHRSLNRQLLTRPLTFVVLLGSVFAIAGLLSS